MADSQSYQNPPQHTRGPWEVHYGHDVTGYPCYYIHGFAGDQKRDDAMHDANARLIAAAPDLLEALKLALGVLAGDFTKSALIDALERGGAAIAKAEGK